MNKYIFLLSPIVPTCFVIDQIACPSYAVVFFLLFKLRKAGLKLTLRNLLKRSGFLLSIYEQSLDCILDYWVIVIVCQLTTRIPD